MARGRSVAEKRVARERGGSAGSLWVWGIACLAGYGLSGCGAALQEREWFVEGPLGGGGAVWGKAVPGLVGGGGENVVFVAGALEGPGAVAESARRVAQFARVYVVDPHEGGDGVFPRERGVGVLERWMRATGVRDAVLVGHDIGAWVAAELAVRAPRLVRGAVLVNPSCPASRRPAAEAVAARAWDLSAVERFEPGLWAELVEEAATLRGCRGSCLEASRSLWARGAGRAGVHDALEEAAGDPLGALGGLAAVEQRGAETRLWVVEGEDDGWCEAEDRGAWAGTFHVERWQRLAGVGHSAPSESPGAVARAVAEALEAWGPGGPVEGGAAVEAGAEAGACGSCEVRRAQWSAQEAARALADAGGATERRRAAAAFLVAQDPDLRGRVVGELVCSDRPRERAVGLAVAGENGAALGDAAVACIGASLGAGRGLGERLLAASASEAVARSARGALARGVLAPALGVAAGSEDSLVRRSVAWGLAALGGEGESADGLRSLARDGAAGVRAAALRALALGQGDKLRAAALAVALEALGDRVASVRYAAVAALGRQGARNAQAAAKVLGLLGGLDAPSREAAVSALGRMDVEALLPRLAERLAGGEGEAGVRRAAALALGGFPHPWSADALFAARGDKDPGVRAGVWLGVARVARGAAAKDRPFLHLDRFAGAAGADAGAGGRGVRRAAVEALAALEEGSAGAALVRAVRDGDGVVRGRAVAAVGQRGGPVRAVLERATHDGDAFVRAVAWEALVLGRGAPVRSGVLRTELPGRPLIGGASAMRGLEDRTALVRVAVLRATAARGERGLRGFRGVVERGLRDPDGEVRVAAVRAAAAVWGADCAGLRAGLGSAIDDEDALVRREGRLALSRLGCGALDVGEAVRQLWQAAGQGGEPGSGSAQVRRRADACRLVGAVGGQSECEVVGRGLSGGSDVVREACVRAAGAACPGLLVEAAERLGSDAAAEVRRAYWVARGRRGGAPAGLLAAGLADADAGVRRLAVGELAAQPQEAGVRARLLAAVSDPAPGVREAALAGALSSPGTEGARLACGAVERGMLGAEEVVDAALAGEKRGGAGLGAVVAECGSALGEEILRGQAGLAHATVDGLADAALSDPRGSVRAAGLRHWLLRRSDRPPTDVLLALGADGEAGVRALAFEILGSRRGRGGEALLLRGLADRVSAVRGAALKGLTGRSFDGLEAELLARLQVEPVALLRLLLLSRVAEDGSRGAVTAALLLGLRDADVDVRVRATVLAGRGDFGQLRDALVERVQRDESPLVRANALACFPGSEAPLEVTRAALGDGNPEVRSQAVQLLAEALDRGAERRFVGLAAADPAGEVRAAALEALGRLGARQHWRVVAKGLGDPCATVRRSAGGVLGALGLGEAAPALRRAVDAEGDADVREALESALRSVEGARAGAGVP